ncbi:LCP family protein [Liquorilactobacillus sicerae]|uniref:LCP family glycopolymer transferase n=1 Tax=Liquorilactobacillus sicerae TaxID=1416943 RepID=UPI00248062C7|nr:LCP family protein [Liquorilactobacillus sicerae]
MDKNDKKNFDFVETPLRRSSYNNLHRKVPAHILRKKICGVLLIILLISFYSAGAYAYHLLSEAKTTIHQTYQKTNVKKLRNVSQVLKQKKPVSILLLGTDTGALGRTDKGRTDTLIVATINPTTKKATLTSIPRDTQVKIAGDSSSYGKINSAYTIGGVSSTIKTIQNTLHIPIDFYLLLNMGGLRKIVDDLNGITIKPLLTFNYSYAHVKKGKTVTLNGKQALSYSRMRYSDPEGDYGRQKRQKQVIKAIINKALSTKTITNYKSILKTVKSNMQTDLTYNDMITLETNYKDAAGSIKSYVLQGEDATIGGLSYQVATAEEKRKTSNRIRASLDLNPSTANFVGQINSYSSNYGNSYNSNRSSTSHYYENSASDNDQYYGKSSESYSKYSQTFSSDTSNSYGFGN